MKGAAPGIGERRHSDRNTPNSRRRSCGAAATGPAGNLRRARPLESEYPWKGSRGEDRIRRAVRRGPGRPGRRARVGDSMRRMVSEGPVRRRRPDRRPVSAQRDALGGDGAADGVERPGFRRHPGPHEGRAHRRDGLNDTLREEPGKTHPGSRSRRTMRSRKGAVVDPEEPHQCPQRRRSPGIQVSGDLRRGVDVPPDGPWRQRR